MDLLPSQVRGGVPPVWLTLATYHRWRNQSGSLKAEDAKRLKELDTRAAARRAAAASELFYRDRL